MKGYYINNNSILLVKDTKKFPTSFRLIPCLLQRAEQTPMGFLMAPLEQNTNYALNSSTFHGEKKLFPINFWISNVIPCYSLCCFYSYGINIVLSYIYAHLKGNSRINKQKRDVSALGGERRVAVWSVKNCCYVNSFAEESRFQVAVNASSWHSNALLILQNHLESHANLATWSAFLEQAIALLPHRSE